MNTTIPKVKEEIDWNINNASLLVGKENYLKGDYIDEPSSFITASIRFSDNKWDFSDEEHRNVVINFSSIKSKIFRVLSKKVALRQMFFVGNRSITASQKCLRINSFIRFLEKEKYMYNLKFLTPEIIKEYIEGYKQKGRAKSTLANKLSSIGEFLKEGELAGYDIGLSQYQKVIRSIAWEEIKAQIVANKTPNIPMRIYKKVVQAALKDMDDDSLTIEDRIMACLIVILSHTGMRRGELQLLEINKLQDIGVLNRKKKAYILEFFTYKTTGKKKGRWTKTIAFPNTLKAYQTLEGLSKERRIKGKTNYLFLNKRGGKYSETAFANMFDFFFYRHQELFKGLTDFEQTQVHCQKVGVYLMDYIKRRRFPKNAGGKFFTLNAHQFRVAIANILKDKVSLQWIREHMNHLDEEMTKHYFRDDEIVKETLFKRASSDGNSLEMNYDNQNNFIKNEKSEPRLIKAYEEINKFLKKKKLNIFKDIDQIINTLKYNPLRENVVGVCIKHLGIICERQYRLATFEKWYYLSPTIPNIESFDFTYRRFLDKAIIVQHNKQLVQKDSKYQRDYENEYISLNKFYQNRLLPEYELILIKLKNEGKESLLTAFPQLESIISNIDEIGKEISKWTSALALKNL
ncbi:tyrosine-type recombinase/integrase [Bacillus mycoides]|uniref:tyrosine-type recombinase/integrase n=1 Tax=Bacillus mycoides TaxID=1405 RepID=UPI001C00FB83|nr:tyrosine-type recombinase/integrase [Bacillus mycoides]QWH96974.1 tyrosine-type recombinase/integrase [Bacillus mycoides]